MLASVATFVRAVLVADAKVMEEMASVTNLVNRMFSIAEMGNDSPFNPDDDPAFLQELIALDNLRHIDIQIMSSNANYPQVNAPMRENVKAQARFVNLVYLETEMQIRTFVQANGGIITLNADPADEIGEVWVEARNRFLATLAFLMRLMAVIGYHVQRWTKPLVTIIRVPSSAER